MRAHLLECAAKYAVAREAGPTVVGRKFARDPNFFERLEQDARNFTVRKYDEVMTAFAQEWPDDLPWPDDVPRPDVSRETEKSDSPETVG